MSEVTDGQPAAKTLAAGIVGEGNELARIVLGTVALLGLWAAAWVGTVVWMVWGLASFDSGPPRTRIDEHGGLIFLLIALACFVAGPVAARKISGRNWFLAAWPLLGTIVVVGMVIAAAT